MEISSPVGLSTPLWNEFRAPISSLPLARPDDCDIVTKIDVRLALSTVEGFLLSLEQKSLCPISNLERCDPG